MTSSLQKYDYIISGGGCAGLSFAMHLIASGKFRDKKILLVEKDLKKSNDRTWCFWEQEAGLFDSIVFKSWSSLWFHADDFSKKLSIAPYTYKMIRGIHFYEHCLKVINEQPNIEVLFERVEEVFSTPEATGIKVNGQIIYAQFVFNSILFNKPQLTSKQYWLLQHFKGWVIETDNDQFDSSTATLMDFRIGQETGTAFCYVMPFTNKTALVEYTLFSPKVLEPQLYDEALKAYISNVMGVNSYRVQEEEFGVIPMTNYHFDRGRGGLVNLGTAGGQTKGSSGYTFQFIQKHSRALVQRMSEGKDPFTGRSSARFSFYDSVLLNILFHRSLEGKDIFKKLFSRNDPRHVLKFLDNETSVAEELKIISTLPTLPFMKAAAVQLF